MHEHRERNKASHDHPMKTFKSLIKMLIPKYKNLNILYLKDHTIQKTFFLIQIINNAN